MHENIVLIGLFTFVRVGAKIMFERLLPKYKLKRIKQGVKEMLRFKNNLSSICRIYIYSKINLRITVNNSLVNNFQVFFKTCHSLKIDTESSSKLETSLAGILGIP